MCLCMYIYTPIYLCTKNLLTSRTFIIIIIIIVIIIIRLSLSPCAMYFASRLLSQHVKEENLNSSILKFASC
jgi:hypothetical protein